MFLFGTVGLVRVEAQNLEDSLQFSITEKSNFQSSPTFGVTQMDFGAEPFPQPVFQAANVRVTQRRRHGLLCPCNGVSLTGLELSNQGFGLADVKSFFKHPRRGQSLVLFA